jgi:tagatose-6-phosphate ketose/aldose isomerase
VNPLQKLLALPQEEQEALGLVHTGAEIAQQPATWKETRRIFLEEQARLKEFLQPTIDHEENVFLVGAGSSDYIGGCLTHLLRMSWGVDVQAVPSTDLLTNLEELVLPEKLYLWISFSRSGDSPEGVAVLEEAIKSMPNVRHLIVSCNRNAKMVRIAGESPNCMAVVLAEEVNDRSLAMTSSFTNMVVFGQCLANIWKDDDYDETLLSICEAAEYLLDEGSILAEQYAQQEFRNACFIGAGSLAAAARESALKMTELTAGATRAISETTLGLRHGPMSSLSADTLFVMLMSRNERRSHYDAGLLAEIRRKDVVGALVAVGRLSQDADHSLYHPSFDTIPDKYAPVVYVLFGQLLGFFASLRAGLQPDSPSPAGIISRVVGQFAIYS